MKQTRYVVLLLLFLNKIVASSSIVTAEIAVGELIDKITILRIKVKRITDESKLKNIKTELATLEETLDMWVPKLASLETLTQELQQTNEALWDIEDAIREKERFQEFDEEFIKLSRSVYFTNDKRCEIKRQINIEVGSRLIEEKSYTDYRTIGVKKG